jgi:hypothetical protein
MEDLGDSRSPRRPLSARMYGAVSCLPTAGRARPSTARPRLELADDMAEMRIAAADFHERRHLVSPDKEAEQRASLMPAARAHKEIMKVALSSLATAHRARGLAPAAPLRDETPTYTDSSKDTHTVLLS